MQNKENNRFFQELIAQHKGILFKVARMYCQDEEDRQDLIQEIMIQIWHSSHRYNNRFSITTWLYRISLNVAISFYRKNKIRKDNNLPLNKQIFQVEDAGDPGNEQQLVLLEQFISELKQIDKGLMLLYLEDKSHNEIADILGITTSNVSTRLVRIKTKLKQRFSQYNL